MSGQSYIRSKQFIFVFVVAAVNKYVHDMKWLLLIMYCIMCCTSSGFKKTYYDIRAFCLEGFQTFSPLVRFGLAYLNIKQSQCKPSPFFQVGHFLPWCCSVREICEQSVQEVVWVRLQTNSKKHHQTRLYHKYRPIKLLYQNYLFLKKYIAWIIICYQLAINKQLLFCSWVLLLY